MIRYHLTYTISGKKHPLSVSHFWHKFLQQSLLDFPNSRRLNACSHCLLHRQVTQHTLGVNMRWQITGRKKSRSEQSIFVIFILLLLRPADIKTGMRFKAF